MREGARASTSGVEGQRAVCVAAKVDFIDDKTGKPVGINSHIGHRPIAASGNSDGDQRMLEWMRAGGGARLMVLVHHDEAVRAWTYGAESEIATFSGSLTTEATKNG
jgi:hypothetical protein